MAAAKKKVGTKKRVGRRKHPGVTLATPAGTHWYRLIWTDPDTGKRKKETLGRELNKAHATEAARRKSEQIAQRKRELAAGAVRATGADLAEAVEGYFQAQPHLRESTRETYKVAVAKFVQWAKDNGIKSGDDLTRGHLVEFREGLVKTGKRVRVVGRKRKGPLKATAKAKAPATINHDLRAVHTCLAYLIDRETFPKLTHDDLRRSLKHLKEERDVTDYLSPADCQRLLEAALRHDGERVISREDEQRIRKEAKARGLSRAAYGELPECQGTTPRYEPIAPFVAFMLLTGMRLSEGIELVWSQVDLTALDDYGKESGAITLKASGVKTRTGRVVGLEVSPALRALLAAMKLRSGGKGRVFDSRGVIVAAGRRLASTYGAPESFTWQALRRTCGTFLTNSPGIFRSAAAYRSAAQLGHSVQVAEKAYLGVVRGVPRDARTLEAAMQIEAHMQRVIASVRSHMATLTNHQSSIRVGT